jgi:aspartate/methionine/tyrosine aminotransferase
MNKEVDMNKAPAPHTPCSRGAVQNLPTSKIREIANAGFGVPDVLRFWFGESTRPTPGFITEAAIAALHRNEVFYSHNSGRADLRAALVSYLNRLHGTNLGLDRISVTSSGVSALMLAMQAIVSPGDRVVIVTPVWPNVAQIPAILNAEVNRFSLDVKNGRWHLDTERLLAQITPQTRMLVINSPGNPTGWTMNADSQKIILDHCRRLGVWILADDVYERLVFDDALHSAPSFLRIALPDDRLIVANSFSKAWLMTGWRLGWITAPAELEPDLGKLIEFNTSCAPVFIQAAALAALNGGDSVIAEIRRDLKNNRDFLTGRLSAIEGVDAPLPDGGMYSFFKIAGYDDSVLLAKQLIAEAKLGLAPGAAFGPEGEGWLRWCFAADRASLENGVSRLEHWFAQKRQ